MDKIIQTLTDINAISVTFRLVLATVLAGIIGLEREGKHYPAGFRTHILVCLGSALTMMVGQYMNAKYGNVVDPSRIGAQVVSGVGFLGVGTIISSGGHVKGVTTAAGLWASAAMGLAIGGGFYLGAVGGFLAIYIAIMVLQRINKLYARRHPRQVTLTISLKDSGKLNYISNLLELWHIEINNINFNKSNILDKYPDSIEVVLSVNLSNNVDTKLTMVNLLKEDCVLSANLGDEPA